MNPTITRRQFTKAAAAAIAVPFIFPRMGWGASRRDKINLAWVGLGSQGISNLTNFSGRCNVVALCDVDHRDQGRQSFKTKEGKLPFLEGCGTLYPDAAVYQDFRKMLVEMGDKIDAVGIATHDSTHFPIAYMAMQMGKHVFVQKPLAHSLHEIRTLQQLANDKKLITQMGNQGHAFEGALLIKEWYDAGLIGEVEEVICWTDRPASGFGFKGLRSDHLPPIVEVPAGLDWDGWMGPVEQKAGYSADLHPTTWRAWWDFGCGGLGDIGCHTIDAPYWALGLGSPDRIHAEVDRVDPLLTPDGSVVTYEFPARGSQPPVKLKWYEGPTVPDLSKYLGEIEMPKEGGMIMIGSEGAIFHPGMRARSPRLLPESKWQEYRKNPEMRVAKTLPRVGNIFSDWIDGMENNKLPCSNFNYSAPLTELIVLGTLAIRTGNPIEWDPKSMRITNNNTAAAELVKVAARPGWREEDLTLGNVGKFIRS